MRELAKLPDSERAALIADVIEFLDVLEESPNRENIGEYCELESDEVGQFFDTFEEQDVDLLFRDVQVAWLAIKS